MEQVSLIALWLPILLATVAVFIASSIIWMVLPYHRTDWVTIPNEGSLLQAMRDIGLGRGQYFFPSAVRERAKDPEAQAKIAEGPVGSIIVSGAPNMGKSLVQWLVFCLAVSFMIAYLGHAAIPLGAEYLHVFRVSGTIAVLAYSAARVPNAIWFGQTWGSTWKDVIDGLIYGLLTGGVFGWLWPA